MSGSEIGVLNGLRRWASRLAMAGLLAGGLGAVAPAVAAPAMPAIAAPLAPSAAEVLPAQYYRHPGPPPRYRRGPPPRAYYGRPGYRPGYYAPPRGYRPPPPHSRHRGPPPRHYRY